MPSLRGGADGARFKGSVRLRRFSSPLVQRDVPVWEYCEPYRYGTGTIWHFPGISRSRLSGCWDNATAKDPDDHELIQQHLLTVMQGRARGYYAGKDGRIDPAGGSELI